MIYTSIPWSTDKNIGQYYNSFMEVLGDNDWACFIDGDSCFTTNFWGKQLEDIVAKYPECGIFTARTNRVGCKWQRYGDWMCNDMEQIRKWGHELYEKEYDSITDVTDKPHDEVMGGTLILIKKNVWKKIGGFKTTGVLGVDNDLHWKAQEHGEKVYLMNGVYLMHWYRGGETNDYKHLL